MINSAEPPSSSSLISDGLDASTELLRQALLDGFLEGAESPNPSTRAAVSVFAACALRNALLAEQGLILLKSVWATLLNQHRLQERPQTKALLGSIVTLYINEYYSIAAESRGDRKQEMSAERWHRKLDQVRTDDPSTRLSSIKVS